jgi:hypothetical protein
MTDPTDDCMSCGETTATGPLYSDRVRVATPDGDDAWLCSFCDTAARDHRAPKTATDEPVGTQQFVIPTHIPFFG